VASTRAAGRQFVSTVSGRSRAASAFAKSAVVEPQSIISASPAETRDAAAAPIRARSAARACARMPMPGSSVSERAAPPP
jgi:hypothetical protein